MDTDTDRPAQEKIRDLEAVGPILGLVSTALDCVDWDWLATQVGRIDTLGPILEPTAYRDALYSGTLRGNQRVIEATRDYVARLHELTAEREARSGR